MKLRSDSAANVAFAVACVVLSILGVQRLIGRNVPAPDSGDPKRAIEHVDGQVLRTGNSQRLGSDAARVVLVEFSDFECPFCARFAQDTHERLVDEFVRSGAIQYRFMHFPLELHKLAAKASEAAECAAEHGKFWEMRSTLFANSDRLTQPDLVTSAEKIGVPVPAFLDCLGGTKTQRVQQDIEQAKKLGVRSTPTFLIGRLRPDGAVDVRRRVVGAFPIEVYRDALQDVLSSARN